MFFRVALLTLAVSTFTGLKITPVNLGKCPDQDDSLVKDITMPPYYELALKRDNEIGIQATFLKEIQNPKLDLNIWAEKWSIVFNMEDMPKNDNDQCEGISVDLIGSLSGTNYGKISMPKVDCPLNPNAAVDLIQVINLDSLKAGATAKITLTIKGTVDGAEENLICAELEAKEAELNCSDLQAKYCDSNECWLDKDDDDKCDDRVKRGKDCIEGKDMCVKGDWCKPNKEKGPRQGKPICQDNPNEEALTTKPTIWGRIKSAMGSFLLYVLKVLGWFFRGYQPAPIGFDGNCDLNDDNCDNYEFNNLTCLQNKETNKGTCAISINDECNPDNNMCEKGNVCIKVDTIEKGKLRDEKHICRIGFEGKCDLNDDNCGQSEFAQLMCLHDGGEEPNNGTCGIQVNDECNPDDNMCDKGNVCNKVEPIEIGKFHKEKHICRIGFNRNCDPDNSKCGKDMGCTTTFWDDDGPKCKVLSGHPCDPKNEDGCYEDYECREVDSPSLDIKYTCRKDEW